MSAAKTSRSEGDFNAAVRLFKAGKYEDALMAFNEARRVQVIVPFHNCLTICIG